jgi:hypothetical protein
MVSPEVVGLSLSKKYLSIPILTKARRYNQLIGGKIESREIIMTSVDAEPR